MENKHTPGPWTIAENMYGVGNLLVAGVVKDYQPIANCGYDDTGESQANARLIAAAPEMLAALKSIIEWQDCSTTRTQAKDLLIRNAARAAIAKAEGK